MLVQVLKHVIVRDHRETHPLSAFEPYASEFFNTFQLFSQSIRQYILAVQHISKHQPTNWLTD